MAKKKASRSGFNMSAEVRALLESDPKLKGKEVSAELRKKFPNVAINEASLQVAFSNARRKMGLSKKGKKAVRVRRPAAATAAAAKSVDLAHLQAAREFLAKVGDTKTAIDAVNTLSRLQIGN